MKAILNAINEELHRLRAEGVEAIWVEESTLEALRQAIAQSPRPSPTVPQTSHLTKTNPAPEPNPPRSPEPPARFRAEGPPQRPAPEPVLAPPPLPRLELGAGDKAARHATLVQRLEQDPEWLKVAKPGLRPLRGVGNLDASLLFLGGSPTLEDEQAGQPFLGQPGELLDKMILAMGLRRAEVFLCPLARWRLSGGENPDASGVERKATPAELAYWAVWLKAEIELVSPKVIVVLGGEALPVLLSKEFHLLKDARGKWLDYGGCRLRATYHPTYLLRNNSKKSKRAVWEDLLETMSALGMPISPKQASYFT